MGKSTIAAAIAKRSGRRIQEVSAWATADRYADTLAILEAAHEQRASVVEPIMTARHSAWRTLVLAQAGNNIATQLSEAKIPVRAFIVHPLNKAEIDAWGRTTIPVITDHELGMAHYYSGGIPLLLERILENVPITEHGALEALTSYIVSYCRQQQIFGSPADLDQHIRGDFHTSGITLPTDIPWEKVQTAVFNHHHDPLAVLGNVHAPFAIPRCSTTSDRYREWVEKREVAILSIFLPSTQGKTQTMKEDLGLNLWDVVDRFEGRLKSFGGNARKVSFFSTNRENGGQPAIRGFEGCGMNAKMLDLFLRAHGVGECNYISFDSNGEMKGEITLTSDADPFLLVAYDHEGMYHNQLCIGLGAETYLQAHDIPYNVRYGMGDVWSYDPAHHSMAVFMEKSAFEEPHKREIAAW
jgi:hypothetical protein